MLRAEGHEPRLCSSHSPAPAGAALWPVGGHPSPPGAAKAGSVRATLHNSAPLLLSLFLPDTQLLLFIWITFLCYGIWVVFSTLPPNPAFLRGRIPKKTSFWSELQAHLLSGCSIPGGPCQGAQVSGSLDMQGRGDQWVGSRPLVCSRQAHCSRQGWASGA